MSHPRPTLEAPLTGQALRICVATHETAQWTAYAQALKVAGYRVDAARLAEQLLRCGCANVEDAFGNEVSVQVRVPRVTRAEGAESARPDVAIAEPGPRQGAGFHIAS